MKLPTGFIYKPSTRVDILKDWPWASLEFAEAIVRRCAEVGEALFLEQKPVTGASVRAAIFADFGLEEKK